MSELLEKDVLRWGFSCCPMSYSLQTCSKIWYFCCVFFPIKLKIVQALDLLKNSANIISHFAGFSVSRTTSTFSMGMKRLEKELRSKQFPRKIIQITSYLHSRTDLSCTQQGRDGLSFFLIHSPAASSRGTTYVLEVIYLNRRLAKPKIHHTNKAREIIVPQKSCLAYIPQLYGSKLFSLQI